MKHKGQYEIMGKMALFAILFESLLLCSWPCGLWKDTCLRLLFSFRRGGNIRILALM